MKTLLTLIIPGLVLLGSLSGADKGPVVLIVSEIQHEVPVPPHPEPGKPVHYLLLGNEELDIGGYQAFMPKPDVQAMETELLKVLAAQGFVQTKVGDPLPHLGLFFFWGDANNMIPPQGGEKDPTPKLRQLVGADKIREQDLTLVEGERVGEHVYTNRVYIIVVALDLPSLIKNKKEPVVLWRTRVSVESLDHALPDSFQLMLAEAAPYFGRATDKPVFIDDRTRNASVRLGELKVLELDAKPAAPKPDEPGQNK